MTFLEAIDAAKKGKKIREVNWDKGEYIFYKDGTWHTKTDDGFFYRTVILHLNEEFEIYEDSVYEKKDFLKEFWIVCDSEGEIMSMTRFKTRREAEESSYKNEIENGKLYAVKVEIIGEK